MRGAHANGAEAGGGESAVALVREFETLATLTRSQIDAVVRDPRSHADVVEHCLDECLELRVEAEWAVDLGDDDHARHCEQEASAWRATATAVRRLARREPGRRVRRGA